MTLSSEHWHGVSVNQIYVSLIIMVVEDSPPHQRPNASLQTSVLISSQILTRRATE